MSADRMKLGKTAGGGAVVLLAVALAGPRARVPADVDPVPVPPDVETWLAQGEAARPHVRPGDAKAIVWAAPDSPATTELAVVYLHGFSADRHELAPIPERVAAALGANLFLTRLAGHGRDGTAMGEATAGAWLHDVAEAVAVGRRLGGGVVLMGTSTGATLALWAAAQERWRDDISALVLVSPNLGLHRRSARVLLWPWGGLLARVAVGPERCFEAVNAQHARHWTRCYPSRALLPMMALTEAVGSMDAARVTAPVLVLYSRQDRVVDPVETERFFARLTGTPRALVAVEGGGDPEHHVLAGDILSPRTNDQVVDEIVAFLTPLAAASAARTVP